MDSKYIAIAVVIAIALGVGGYFLGQQVGSEKIIQQTQNLKSLVDIAFPPPPTEFYSLTGMVKGIYGATIQLEIDDPDDYLPQLDGSPRKKEMRAANVTNNTVYTLIDYTNLDSQGNPAQTQIQLADIKVGEIITVRSDQNIRDAEKFDIIAVEIVKY